MDLVASGSRDHSYLRTGPIPWEQFSALEQLASGISDSLEKPFLKLGSAPITPAFLLKAALFLIFLALLSRACQRCVFAGVSLEGATLRQDVDDNGDFLRKDVSLVAGIRFFQP